MVYELRRLIWKRGNFLAKSISRRFGLGELQKEKKISTKEVILAF